MISLGELLGDICPSSLSEVNISSLQDDSRKAETGALVFILPSLQPKDLSTYVKQSLKAHAACVVYPEEAVSESLPSPAFAVPSQDIIPLYIRACTIFYPTTFDHILGVTGTNGKSSTTVFLSQFFQNQGHPAAAIGTLGVIQRNQVLQGKDFDLQGKTSPMPLDLHRTFAALQSQNTKTLALECSSHGLSLDRLKGIPFTSAGFTNLSQDHLDFHHTMDAYFEAKASLFLEDRPSLKARVVSCRTPWGEELVKRCQAKKLPVTPVGREEDQVFLELSQQDLKGMSGTAYLNEKPYPFTTPLVGHFHLENLEVALGMALAEGLAPEELIKSLAILKPVPGRLEAFPLAENKLAVVDYAHTPDALEKALEALRILGPKQLWTVFGCGGNRDQEKRPLMGEIASRLSDKAIVCDDNPRAEDPHQIRSQILAACPGATEIGDREKAIQTALSEMNSGDIVLIAGKGHEDYQIIGTEKRPFSDREIVSKIAHSLKV